MPSQPIARFRNVVLRPHGMQFVIDELHLVSVCVAGLVYGGMEAMPLCGMATAVSLFLLLVLAYRFIYLRLIRYRIGGEQLVSEHGLLLRKVDYMELYRIVDFQEHQSLLQQLCRRNDDIVPPMRDRVVYIKRKKGIYEITNH